MANLVRRIGNAEPELHGEEVLEGAVGESLQPRVVEQRQHRLWRHERRALLHALFAATLWRQSRGTSSHSPSRPLLHALTPWQSVSIPASSVASTVSAFEPVRNTTVAEAPEEKPRWDRQGSRVKWWPCVPPERNKTEGSKWCQSCQSIGCG